MPPRKGKQPPPKKLRKFGWCMDGHHEGCRREYVDWNNVLQTCACQCHRRRKR